MSSLCFTVWQEDVTGERRVFRQGCFNSVPGLSSSPVCGSSCVDNTTSLEDIKHAQLLFCCCNTNNCNQHFTWRRQHSQDITEAHREDELVEARWTSGLYTSLLVVCVVCIILVSLSTLAIIIHNIKARSGHLQLQNIF